MRLKKFLKILIFSKNKNSSILGVFNREIPKIFNIQGVSPMQPGEKLPVLHILHEKYGDLVMPSILKFDLCLTKDREIFSQVTQADSDSGSYSFIMRTGYLFKGTKEELLEWFRGLSSGETFFFFDRVFSDAPIDEGEVVFEEY